MDVAIFWKTRGRVRKSWVSETRETSFILGCDMIDTTGKEYKRPNIRYLSAKSPRVPRIPQP
jgi:hypothetical protein